MCGFSTHIILKTSQKISNELNTSTVVHQRVTTYNAAHMIIPENNRTVLSVSDLNAEVNQLLNQGFPLLWVEGEISNLSRPSSGHIYFSLKDQKAQIRCAMFRNRNMRLSITPENGMKVLVRGRVGLYEPRGDYQLIAEHMEDAGIGLLQKQFEELKKKLSAAGLFDDEHKKECPEFPKHIGVITSPTGAAIRDILHVLERRSPQTPVLIYPVAVQGDKAKIQIETAIRKADLDNKCDVIILARGGGSIEDLWSFNEENVAKAIYQANTPIICGVGHEIDFTIADFVADIRAPTPSAAAELATQDKEQLLTSLLQTELWFQQKMQQLMHQNQQQLDWKIARLNAQKPANKIQQQAQRLDELSIRLKQQINFILENRKSHFKQLQTQLDNHQPSRKIKEKQQRLTNQNARMQQAILHQIERQKSRFHVTMAKLDSISPLKTLERGYSITKDKQSGILVSSVDQIKIEQEILVQLKNGNINAVVKELTVNEQTST